MTVPNPSYEIGGDLPGDADGWVFLATQTWRRAALWETHLDGFTVEQGVEDFSGWAAPWLRDWTDLELLGDTESAGVDTFEDWDPAYQAEWNEAFANPADVSPETFESGWANVPYYTTWSELTTEQAAFDGPLDHDSFEAGWRNDSYALDWGDVTPDPALFDSGHPDPFEDFEEEW